MIDTPTSQAFGKESAGLDNVVDGTLLFDGAPEIMATILAG